MDTKSQPQCDTQNADDVLFNSSQPGAVVDLLGLQDLFDRDPQRDAQRRQERKQQRASVKFVPKPETDPSNKKVVCTAGVIAHPILPNDYIDVKAMGEEFANFRFANFLFSEEKLTKGTVEELTSIFYQLMAADYTEHGIVDQVRRDTWSAGYLRRWLLESGRFQFELNKTKVLAASIAELKNVWFACVVSEVHLKHQAHGSCSYWDRVNEVIEMLRSLQKGHATGQAIAAAEAAGAGNWTSMDLTDRVAAAGAYWTWLASGAGLELNAIEGQNSVKDWKQ